VWRERYGAEFTELLVAEIDERPTDWRRNLDVAMSGSLARLSASGLRAGALTSPALAMRTVVVAVAVFVAAGLSLWSQLRVATTSTAASTAATSGTLLLSVGGGLLVLLVVFALPPVVVTIGRTLRHDRRILRPLGWTVVATVNLAVGAHHFATQGTAVGQGPSLGRAATMSISTYWVHPATLISQPPAVQLWMIASPLCFVMFIMNASQVLRRVDLSELVLRYEARLVAIAIAAMVPMTAAAGWWVIGSQSDPGTALQAGSLDVVLIAAMAAAVAATGSAGRRIRGVSPLSDP
jgi:hypothetical protein